MRKFLRTTKALLVAAGLCVGATYAWAQVTLPTPKYFNDFESYSTDITNGDLTIIGNGEFIQDADARFGYVFHNDPTLAKVARTNYLLLPEDVLSHSSSTNAMTIGFWLHAKSAADFWSSPVFSAYGSSSTTNSWPMFAAWTGGTLQVNCAGWTNFPDVLNDNGTNYYGTFYLDDAAWHYYTITLTGTVAKVYFDGVVVNFWDMSKDVTTDDGKSFAGLFSNGGDLKYVCLGGCQPWGGDVIDPAFAFDDIAVYDEALSQAQIKAIIGAKMPITSLPASYGFSTWNATNTWPRSNVSPFDAGTIVKGTNVTALNISNTTATAYFDSDTSTDGNQAYELSDNETVTTSFTAYHGWLSTTTCSSTIQLLNSDGVALVSYTYDIKNCKVTDVSFAGEQASGFNEFSGQSRLNASKSAAFITNTSSNTSSYVTNDGYNPVITMSVSKNGLVSFNLSIGLTSVSESYSKILTTSGEGAVKMDLASIKVIDTCSDANRAFCMSNLSITSEVAAKHIVTFAYTDTDDNSLSLLKPNSFVQVDDATTVESLITDALKATFYNGDNSTRYDYSTYSVPEDATTVTGDVTITLKFAAKARKAYTVKAVDSGSTELFDIESGNSYVGDNVTVPFNKYYKSGTTLLQADAIDADKKQFSYTFTIGESGNDKTVTYKASSINNVVFYSEGEDLGGSVVSVGTLSQRGSGQKGVAGTNLVVTSLPAGKYTVTVCLGGKKAQAHSVKAGENTIITVSNEEGGDNYLNDATLHTITSAEFTLTETTNITYSGGYATTTAGNAQGLDYVYVVKTAEAVTIAESGYSSLASAYGLNFADIDGLTAYVVTKTTNEAVTLTSVDELPANRGVILKGTGGATYSIPVKADAAYAGTNLLSAAVTATDIDANTAYILQGGLFHLVTAASTVPAGKAYLPASNVPSAARSLGFMFGDESTGINAVSRDLQNGEFYNLQGQRVDAPLKGLYIVNGKKVLVK